MKILTVLTYYRPHTSGLTIYAERLARAFAKRGHQVTVMTTQYDPSLLLEETLDGVKIIRVPIAARISKGVIAPTFGLVATKLVAQNDVIQMHLPQFDAPGVALRGRLLRKPAVLTYHCDLLLPPGFFNRFVNAVVDFQNNMAGILANHIVTYTQDYADHSPYLSRYASKLTPILPPVELPDPLPGAVQAFAEEHHVKNRRPVIGMAARFAAEKGVDVLPVPSLNSTEAFGLVQIEAMMNGVPCVPSGLPGVRQPVMMHKMGRVAQVGDSDDLAACILEVLNEPDKYRGDVESIKKAYNPDSIAAEYEKLFERLMKKGR